MKYEPTAVPRAVARIHSANCHCPRCMHHGTGRADPRELRIRVAMFGLAAVIGGLLGHNVTPQQIAAGIVQAAR